MPRRARLILPGIPLHVIQRGNNRQACFFDDADRRAYLGWLAEHAEATACRVHAYVLMTNHVHLLVSSDLPDGAGRLMKALGQRYVQRFNRVHQRTGTLWEGRFRSCLVQDETYLFLCQRYIELNPVRGGMVARPGDYPWSSYHANADGRPEKLVTPHERYLALGADAAARQAAYRALFRDDPGAAQIDTIRRATNGNFVLGDEAFAARLAGMIGRRVLPGSPGRPRRDALG